MCLLVSLHLSFKQISDTSTCRLSHSSVQSGQEMASPKVEQVSPGTILGEGPHWDHNAQALYYVDIRGPTVNKYDPATKKHTTAKIEGGTVSLIIPVEGKKDEFVITVGRNVAIMTWDGVSSTPSNVKIVATVHDEKKDNIFNDGKADPTGRLWAGTMGPELAPGKFDEEAGSLFSFDKKWKPSTHVTGISISNGMAWSDDLKHMYYIDSLKYAVDIFDLDAKNAKLSNRRVAFDFVKNGVKGLPDGMAIDTEGKLWVAVFDGSGVIRVDPTTGKLLSRIHVPSQQTTSVAFGGPNLDELYITSANIRQKPEDLQPGTGATFRVTGIGAKGYPGQNVIL